MKYFITGGTGFIGRRLVESVLSQGGEIVLLARESSDLKGLKGRKGIEIKNGSLFDRESLAKAMKGCNVALHLAGYAKNWNRDKSVFTTINVDGSMNVAKAASSAGVPVMVDVSSIVTFGPTDKRGTARTDRGAIIRFTEYEKSKAESEEKLKDFAKEHKEIRIVMVNPARVYGPGLITEANSLTLIIRNYLKYKLYLLLGTGKNIANYVFVEDIVSGILLAAEKGKSGERYILGGECSSLIGFFEKIRRVSGKRAVPIFVPKPIAMMIGFFAETSAKAFHIYPFITPPWVRHFCADWIYDCEKAKKELGYIPTPLEKGLKTTIDWLEGLDKKAELNNP